MFRETFLVIGLLCATFNGIIGKSIAKRDVRFVQRPTFTEPAKMARYLVHRSNWTSMGTISTYPAIRGSPMVNVVSVADSELGGKSTGNIYFLLTDLDFTGQDLKANDTLTALFSEDQDLTCTKNNTDSMEPTCGRTIISGKMKRLDKSSAEHAEADQFFKSRHPASAVWQQAHSFYFCKLEIEQIVVLAFYGGAQFVTPDDYYKANLDDEVVETHNIDDIHQL